jgi:hypothetical protein
MSLKKISFGVLFLSIFFITTSFVLAEDNVNTPANVSSSPRPGGLFNFIKPESPRPSGSPKPFTLKMDRLKDIRLKFCQVHHDEIANNFGTLENLVTDMLSKLDLVASNVENFYTNKVIPQNKSVDNYATLTADIAAKKLAVQNDLANAKADVAGFSCTGDNPKGQIVQYRQDMQLVKKDLQGYRTSIKNLIEAIKSIIGVAST